MSSRPPMGRCPGCGKYRPLSASRPVPVVKRVSPSAVRKNPTRPQRVCEDCGEQQERPAMEQTA